MNAQPHAGGRLVRADAPISNAVQCIDELLDEVAAAENADPANCIAVPDDRIAEQLAELCGQLQHWFELQPGTDQRDRQRLLRQLDDVFELTGSPLRGAAPVSAVRSSFHRFEQQLAEQGLCAEHHRL